VKNRTDATALALATALLFLAAGCSGSADPAKNAAAEVLPTLQLAAEDLLALQMQSLADGPTITGSILPAKRADLRAEISAVVLAVPKENGDPVHTGDVLVRLDDTSIRDSLASARTAATAASDAFDQAQRQYERMQKLRADGLVSIQQLEDAEVRRNSARSDSESARSRLAAAEQQQDRTVVRAPFAGIVSDRQVSAGDTAQIGKELVKVIDPASLRFEGFVSTSNIAAVRVGQTVSFHIHGGEDHPFTGTITRINPAANQMTRQVEVLVDFTSGQQPPGIAGLYAEGQVEVTHTDGLALPANAIVRDGDDAHAWVVKGGKLVKALLKLGARDERSGNTTVLAGLAAGDQVLRYPNSALHDGQPAKLP
jgi:membrane fusion protein (multidrug efflux system)